MKNSMENNTQDTTEMPAETPENPAGEGDTAQTQPEPEKGEETEKENADEIENAGDSEIFTSSEAETSSEAIESSEIADSSEAETETETSESSEIADSSEAGDTESPESAMETEDGDSAESTLTISDDTPHDGETAGETADTYIQEFITALNEQFETDREEMSKEHEELMETVNSINTTATLCVGFLLCILLCCALLFGAHTAKTFWERFRN